MNLALKSSSGPARPRLTGQGWAVLGVGALLVSTLRLPEHQPEPLAAILGLGLWMVLGLARWMAPRSLGGIRGRWVLPAWCHALEDVTMGAALEAPDGAPPFSIEAWQATPRRFEIVARLAGLDEKTTRASWVTSFPKRGRHWLPALTLQAGEPFGLVAASRRLGSGIELVVFPPLGRLQRGFEMRIARWLETQALSAHPGDDDPAQLRPYRPGDPPHAVHWKASARRRSMLVVERHAAGCRRLALAVDTPPGAPAWKLERLISIAATLIDYFCAQGWTVSLHGPCAPDGLEAGRAELMETLALAGPHPGDLLSLIPRNRACLILAINALDRGELPGQALVLTLAECEQSVLLPGRVR